MKRSNGNGHRPIRIGVVGYGYWGPNLVRNFVESSDTKMIAVADLSAQRLAEVRQRHPEVLTLADPEQLINSNDIDAIAIATPPAVHFELAMKALDAGKHVLVEKPLATNSADARALIRKAARQTECF